MHFAIPEEEPIVGRKYGVNAIPAPSFPNDTVTLGTSFIIEDYVDTTPPTPGNLRVTGEVFTNDCGAKALVLEDAGTTDDFLTGTRVPILVTLRTETTTFQTVTGTFGFTNDITGAVIAKAPYLGRCITDEGLETLDFARGEMVEVTMVVYDFAGNAGEPVVQTLEWPIGELPAVPSEPAAGTGCDVSRTRGAVPLLVLVALAISLTTRRRRMPSDRV